MCKQQFTAKMILCATVKLCDIPECKLYLNKRFLNLDTHSKIVDVFLVNAYSPQPLIRSTQTTPRDDYWNSCIYRNHTRNIHVATSPNWTYLHTCLLSYLLNYLLIFLLTYLLHGGDSLLKSYQVLN
jgi:hypothetical protein